LQLERCLLQEINPETTSLYLWEIVLPAGGPMRLWRPASRHRSEGLAMTIQTSLRIVVVDDSRDAAESLAILLKLEGYEVEFAQDGASALRLCSEFRPNVMFVDIAMPKMDGNALAQAVRRLDGCKETLLVAITGYADDAHRRASMAAGFDHYLVKPVDPDVLHELLARHRHDLPVTGTT
jgi:CheY-like chemotaxis protein